MPGLRLRRLEERFVRYCKVDTQSNPLSNTTPSTACQLDLSRMLVTELKEIGINDARLTDYGVVLATLPGNREGGPVIAFVAHVDTSPAFHAQGVKPIVHRNWNGQTIVLPDDPSVTIDPRQNPYLAEKKGDDIVTAGGTTLLGADDKAGIAVIMGLLEYLLANPEFPRGDVRICFTPDEEIGLKGVSDQMVTDLNADFAYALDGADPGELVTETFSADSAVITIKGVSIHSSCAKGRLVNALYLAAQIVNLLPKHRLTPESTGEREGYIFLNQIDGNAAEANLFLHLRDFELEGLEQQAKLLEEICHVVAETEPRAMISCQVIPRYRNMRYGLEKDMRPVTIARKAYEDEGLTPEIVAFRGGTDGSMMTEKGVPTPNIFCGAQNPHGPTEWVSLQDMDTSLRICARVVSYWADSTLAFKDKSDVKL
ncbi:MAG: peptidase T [Desulfobacterales bacterium]|nr:peptidase T [Desulfobacterales bacterium]